MLSVDKVLATRWRQYFSEQNGSFVTVLSLWKDEPFDSKGIKGFPTCQPISLCISSHNFALSPFVVILIGLWPFVLQPFNKYSHQVKLVYREWAWSRVSLVHEYWPWSGCVRRWNQGHVLLLRCDAVASPLANGSAAFIWNLRCHWLFGSRQRHIAQTRVTLYSIPTIYHSLFSPNTLHGIQIQCKKLTSLCLKNTSFLYAVDSDMWLADVNDAKYPHAKHSPGHQLCWINCMGLITLYTSRATEDECIISPVTRLLVQKFKANKKKSSSVPLWGEYTGNRWTPLTKGQ